MSKLSINFLGEKIELDFPDTLSTLYQKIMDNFFLSEKDVTELLITYSQDYDKMLIETEEDFKYFVEAKVYIIDIDINQRSELYKNILLKINDILKAANVDVKPNNNPEKPVIKLNPTEASANTNS